MSDWIEIRGLRVVCNVGVPDDERSVPQPLEIDVELHVDLDQAARSDDVTDTVDYGAVTVAVAEAISRQAHALLERVAGVAADAALGVDTRATAVTVTVRKIRPPIPLDVVSTAVRLCRSRS